MWHNLVWIGGIWLIATASAWLICTWRGYSFAAWSFTIAAFCLGIFVGAERGMESSTCPSYPTTTPTGI